MPRERIRTLLTRLDQAGEWLAPLGLRLILAHEFWIAGLAKLGSPDRFAGIQARFPFPFSHLPTEITWYLVIGLELIAPIALMLGLGTRLAALSLALLTLLSMAVLHAGPDPVSWRMAGFYLTICLALILSGPGRLSLDHWLRQRHFQGERRLWS